MYTVRLSYFLRILGVVALRILNPVGPLAYVIARAVRLGLLTGQGADGPVEIRVQIGLKRQGFIILERNRTGSIKVLAVVLHFAWCHMTDIRDIVTITGGRQRFDRVGIDNILDTVDTVTVRRNVFAGRLPISNERPAPILYGAFIRFLTERRPDIQPGDIKW